VTPGWDGNAIVYCEGAFNTPNGKTAHGLVRFTERYRVLSVVDSRYAGRDAGEVLDGTPLGIPVVASLDKALAAARSVGESATHLVIGIAPDGGRLSPSARSDVMAAITHGLNVDCGLHDFLGKDPEIAPMAERRGVVLRDVRRPPPRAALHSFTGKIEEVTSFRVAMLGTDSAVGKRTTAWHIVQGMRAAGVSAEFVGTGQTAWMQGARHGIVLDSLVNDFVSGETEHAVWSAWKESSPEVIVLEGQGSLLNPAYPGGFELLAAGRPHVIVLQHAPTRVDYDGFPGYRLHPLPKQIRALEEVSDRPVVAVTVNHEGIPRAHVRTVCATIARVTGLPVFDTLVDGPAGLVAVLREHVRASVEPRARSEERKP
jgi:uncharacterized NAD-dependent epimerase/dehydratase family protein